MAMTLGYWDIRGLAHAIRLLLEYTDSTYEEKKYTMGDAPDFDRSQWLSEKFKLGLDFPNLPYLIDGTHRLTQSNAILRYLARKHNLCGETEEEKIRVDMLENEAMDTANQLARVCYSPDFVGLSDDLGTDPGAAGDKATHRGSWGTALGGLPSAQGVPGAGGDSRVVPQEKQKPEFLKVLPEKLKLFSQFLGKKAWFAGDKLTYVDFLAYDVLDLHRIFEPTCLDAFPNLRDFIARIEGLEKIAAYMKSSRFLPAPIYTKIALAHAIRLLLEYTDSTYEEKKYTLLGDAPDFDRSQWLSEKFKLGLDFPNEKQKPEFLKVLPEKLKLFSQFLGKKAWFAGDKLTYVDFLAYDLLGVLRMFEPTCLDAFPNLKDFLGRFEGLKRIAAYMKTSRFLPTPVYSKAAQWGNK
ncbi:hypothetical protein QTO34_011072 [Cnephaeus nilssonii]|uniref:glutathione transferase n=1 Tax=Cnephaeus nilssonii TaxID=3371016 RepID=A0AA40HDL8_CNENI|nr:hypothetical protein QTO34_011072 [Eptesicus nilssonii]